MSLLSKPLPHMMHLNRREVMHVSAGGVEMGTLLLLLPLLLDEWLGFGSIARIVNPEEEEEEEEDDDDDGGGGTERGAATTAAASYCGCCCCTSGFPALASMHWFKWVSLALPPIKSKDCPHMKQLSMTP
jgi:hypothetical protein